jgi:hypothetical protein
VKRLFKLFAGLMLLALLTGCAASEPPIELSASRPSLLFFYTDG